jgi:SanA protein
MLRRLIRTIIRTSLSLMALAVFLLGAARLVMEMTARSRIYPPDQAPAYRIAIVFGAGLWRDGTPTPVLRDRVETAVVLYQAGKVEKLLMSGDNRFEHYNEPAAMQAYAISLGVPEEAIVLDYAGRRTYDTCYRAKAIFGVEQALLVTQRFHLARALYTCQALGLNTAGVAADRRQYSRGSLFYWNIREFVAAFTAMLDVHILQPLPVLGEYEPILPAD